MTRLEIWSGGKAAHDFSRVDEEGLALLADLKTVIVSEAHDVKLLAGSQLPGDVVKVSHGKVLTADFERNKFTGQMDVGIPGGLLGDPKEVPVVVFKDNVNVSVKPLPQSGNNKRGAKITATEDGIHSAEHLESRAQLPYVVVNV